MPFAMMDEKHPTVLSRELRLPEGRSFLVLPSTPTYVDGLFQATRTFTYMFLTYCPSITERWTDVQRKDS